MTGTLSFTRKIQKRIFTVLFLVIGIKLALTNPVAQANNDNFRFAEKVNLAMRRTAHHLLLLNGDSTSTIPPVKQIDGNTYSVRVDHLFDYGKLPELLQQSLEMQQIEKGYNVSVLSCDNGTIQLGYHFSDLKQPGGVPCADRKNEEACYTLQVNFIAENPSAADSKSNWWILPFGSALAGLGFFAWTKSRRKPVTLIASIADEKPVSTIHFGNSHFDTQNQTLVSGSVTHQLTFREAKLLNLLTRHSNQVLERDFILKSVWKMKELRWVAAWMFLFPGFGKCFPPIPI
ncbi:winged helix family transcriptional regulator [Dyadobacter sp. CY323]|uniref:winged helix-turn-helix domain-containing protein n=1 Tax=Dyadobacter sp. CY323 TaxID=2907302 RepID=UPI001F4894C9|nr:winged helix family transcriptional regulator [Dyadobacter sp. CY323]MCE6992378.1 winged helix family transcriptional regulator [Dyadobacter sp. CY323]